MLRSFGSTLYPGQAVNQTAQAAAEKVGRKSHLQAAGAFELQLQKSLDQKLTFSAHAKNRLQARNIKLTEVDLDTLNQAVNRAKEKGGRDLLILYQNNAFVVSVPNRTVITAVDRQSFQSNVFTQIDSAMIL